MSNILLVFSSDALFQAQAFISLPKAVSMENSDRSEAQYRCLVSP